MHIELNTTEVETLKGIIAKAMKEKEKEKEQNFISEGYKSILLSYKILESSDFEIKRQKGLIQRYEHAYDVLGENQFLNIIKKVYHLHTSGKVKNIKMYAITCLEKEMKEV